MTLTVFVVGPRKGMARPNPRPFAKGYSPAAFDPVRYGHLVEGGRKSVGASFTSPAAEPPDRKLVRSERYLRRGEWWLGGCTGPDENAIRGATEWMSWQI